MNLVDLFEDDSKLFIVIKNNSSDSLREFLAKNSSLNGCDVLKIMTTLISTIKSLQLKNIVHRQLTLDAIKIKKKKDQYTVVLGCFDCAIMLKKDF